MPIRFLPTPLQLAQLKAYADQTFFTRNNTPVEFIVGVVFKAASLRIDVEADSVWELANDELTAIALLKMLGYAEMNMEIIKLEQ